MWTSELCRHYCSFGQGKEGTEQTDSDSQMQLRIFRLQLSGKTSLNAGRSIESRVIMAASSARLFYFLRLMALGDL
jgi:hypothetical protein